MSKQAKAIQKLQTLADRLEAEMGRLELPPGTVRRLAKLQCELRAGIETLTATQEGGEWRPDWRRKKTMVGRCGAPRLSDGKPCQGRSLPGRVRCKWHEEGSTVLAERALDKVAARLQLE